MEDDRTTSEHTGVHRGKREGGTEGGEQRDPWIGVEPQRGEGVEQSMREGTDPRVSECTNSAEVSRRDREYPEVLASGVNEVSERASRGAPQVRTGERTYVSE